MTRWRVWWSRTSDLCLATARERRLDEEFAAHLELLTAEHRRRGLSPEDATAAARRDFGNLERWKAIHRDQRGWPSLDAWRQDLRFAFRLLARDRWLTVAAVLTLALGIGANAMVFTTVSAVLLRGLPFTDAERVVSIGTHDEREPRVRGPRGYGQVSHAEFTAWRAATRSFAAMGAFAAGTMNLADGGDPPQRLIGSYVSAGSFALIGRAPLLGREFIDRDEAVGAAAVVVLGHGVWKSRYGADPSVLGRTIRINGEPATIVGVMPEGFKFPADAEAWQPLSRLPGLDREALGRRPLSVFGRLTAHTTPQQAQADLDTVAERLGREQPSTNRFVRTTVTSYAGTFPRPGDATAVRRPDDGRRVHPPPGLCQRGRSPAGTRCLTRA